MALLDPRIGRRAPNGKIVRAPSLYVTGEGYIAGANPAPTLFWIDVDQEYFVILPVSLAHISDKRHLEMLMLVGKPEDYEHFYGRAPQTDDEAAMQAEEAKLEALANQDNYPEAAAIAKQPQRTRIVVVGGHPGNSQATDDGSGLT